MSRSANLMRLQTIDSQITNTHNRIDEIEKALREKNELIKSETAVIEAEKRLADSKKLLNQTEKNVRDQQLKIEQTDSALYGGKIRNPKELQDLHNEAAALRRYLSVLEDRQIEAMISLEDAENKHQSVKSKNEIIKNKLHAKNVILSKEYSQINIDLNRLKLERDVVIHTLERNDLEEYEKLRKNRRGIAVTPIVDTTCGACGTTLTPAIRQSAQSPTQIVQCPSCRRILYPG